MKFRTLRNDVSIVRLYCFDPKKHQIIFNKVFSDENFDYFEARVKVKSQNFKYYFEVVDGNRTVYYDKKGPSDEKPLNEDFFLCDLSSAQIFETPAWVGDSIFYQIFPDRFYNGDKGNDPPNTKEWGGKPRSSWDFFGGDLRGVIEKLSYLKDLGINAIWFTPIFKSRTNHKYDVSDYYRVDEHFGDLETLKELVKKAHGMGIKIILDGVFNHSGFDFWAFQDALKKGRKSKYKDWYIIHKFPLPLWRSNLVKLLPSKLRRRFYPLYERFPWSWAMPKFNFDNAEVREYVLKVAEYWIGEMGIDGWRLDVAHGVPHDFWREFRRRVKELKPDAYIMGEISFFATPWLKGDEFDATMNYELYRAMVAFFAENSIDVDAFDHKLAELRKEYPLQANFVMYNFLDNHDTHRFLTLCKGDTDKMKLALIFLMTYIGAPAIFYGDEVGVQGGNDPDCRRTMIWDEGKQNRELLIFCKKLIQIRRSVSALRHGTFSALLK
ncbi:MAG: glycoside hydrolase family 13 protein, partial [Candidatus Zixiibacteriota bacterium]